MTLRRGLVLVGLLLLPALSVLAEPPAATGGVEVQLQSLSRSLSELVTLLRQQLAGQRSELLMRRVELERGRLLPLETALQGARSQRQSYEDQLANFQGMAGSFEVEEQARGESSGAETAGQEEGAQAGSAFSAFPAHMKEHLETQMKLLKQRLREADDRIAELENEIGAVRRSVDSWQGLLDREFPLR
ncbi:MAG TPA: hypothetical protein PK413_13195 [Thermoanaerobaculia bacterium]|nr:hypothetical protein [Thermoanaerobaculia bacterium]